MRRFFLLPVLVLSAHAADLCPPPAAVDTTASWQSYSAKNGSKRCVANLLEAHDGVVWPAAGIEQAAVAGHVEVAVCCYRHESAQPEKLRIGDREQTVVTHREDPKAVGKADDDDDFPDLIEDDAHGRAVSIRGMLGDGDRPVRVDVLLRCTASKFADQYAFQFTVINRSEKGVEVDWDHLRQVRAGSSPNIQPVAGGMAYVFLTAKRPHEAVATVEVKSAGRVLGRFRFDGFTLAP
jgi:hypothetical protein